MKKFIAFLLIFGLLAGTSSGVVWDFMKLFQGSQMIPTGAPWIPDDGALYFGNGKDGNIMYDETTDDKLEISGTVVMQNTLGLKIADISAAATTYTVSTLPQIIFVDASSANATVVLPDAATVKGVPIRIVAKAAPGSNYLRINSTGGDLINGVACYATTGNINDQVTLVSNASTTYADYYMVDYTGTWAEQPNEEA